MYIERDWKNSGESGAIAINAENLNYMDNAIYKKMQRNKFSIPYYYFTNIRELFKPYQSNSWAAGKWGSASGGTVTSYTTTLTVTMTNLGDGGKLVNCVPPTYINALKTENNSSLSNLDFLSVFFRLNSTTYANMTTNSKFRLTINKGTSTELTNYAYYDFPKSYFYDVNWIRFDILLTDFTTVGTFDWTQTNGVGIELAGQVLTAGNAILEIGSIQICRRIFDGTYDTANPFQRRNGNIFIADYQNSQYGNNSFLFAYRYNSTSLILQTFPINNNDVYISGIKYSKANHLRGNWKILETQGNENFKSYVKFKLLDANLNGLSFGVSIDGSYAEQIWLRNVTNKILFRTIENSVDTTQTIDFTCTLNDVISFESYYLDGIITWICKNITTGYSTSWISEKSETFKNSVKYSHFGSAYDDQYVSFCEIQDVYADFY